MARTLTRLLILSGELVAEQPLCVGGLDALATSDMPVAVDGQGRPYLPGTSLAGALFASWGVAETDPARGAVDHRGSPARASSILIDDAPAKGVPTVELWHGVGIDRATGTAAVNIKFDREVLPIGTRFAFALRYEVENEGTLAQARARMHTARRVLEQGLALGAGVTRGLGLVRLENARAIEVDWRSPEAVLDCLMQVSQQGADAGAHWQAAAQAVPARRTLAIRIHWRPTQPLMSKAAYEGLATDILPFVSRAADGRHALTLSGASIKGALREQAERIVRTVLRVDLTAGGKHHETVDVPLVRELFGLARRRTQSRAEHSGPGRGRLAVRTVQALQAHGKEHWDALADSAQAPAGIDRAMHVAIDRWTGGAAEAFLYSAAEPQPTPWAPIELVYDGRRAADRESGGDDACCALLWLLLEDLRLGRIALGFGKNRGYGAIEIDRFEFDGALAQELGLPPLLAGGSSLLAQAPPRLREAWSGWLAEQRQEVDA